MDKRSLLLTFLASAVLFGFGYSQDILQALQGPFRSEPYNFTPTQFNLLYFFTFLPIALLDIPIGMIVDKYPIKISMYTLLIISLIAQITIALSLQFMVSHYLWIMYGMRSAFGIAGEGMFTVQGIIVAKYAKSNYQIIMGVALSLPFLMDAINSGVTTAVYDETGYMALTWYIGVIICLASLICGIILHKKFMASDDLRSKQIETKINLQKQEKKKQQQQNGIFAEEQQQQQHFSFKTLKSLSKQFWILTGAIFFAQASLGPFNDNLNDLIVKRFNIPYATVGKLLLIPFTFLAPFSLAVGTICTKKPHYRRNIMLISSLIYFSAIFSLYLLPNTKQPDYLHYFVIVLFLLSQSCQFSIYYAGMVTSVPYVVQKKMVGTAFGVSGSAMALAQCATPLCYMVVMESSPNLIKQYQNLNLFGVGIACITILFSLCMKRNNFTSLDFKLEDQKHSLDQSLNHIQQEKHNQPIQQHKENQQIYIEQNLRQSLLSND